jgi:hypothetical protein
MAMAMATAVAMAMAMAMRVVAWTAVRILVASSLLGDRSIVTLALERERVLTRTSQTMNLGPMPSKNRWNLLVITTCSLCH